MVWTLPANGAGPSVTLAKRSHEGSHTHLAVVQKQQSAGHQSEPAPLAHFGHVDKVLHGLHRSTINFSASHRGKLTQSRAITYADRPPSDIR